MSEILTEWKNRRRKGQYFDFSLLFGVFFLLIFGIIMIYSSSSYVAERDFHSSTYFLKRQLFAVGVGIVAMFATSGFPMKWIRKFSIVLYGLSIFTVMLLPVIGISSHGATRWISLGAVNFQPAELCKLAIIVLVADLICRLGRSIDTPKGVFIVFGVASFSAGLVYILSKNLSSGFIIFAIAFFMMFSATRYSNRYLLVVVMMVIVVAVAVFIIAKMKIGANFRFQRVLAWLNPEEYADGKGFQTLQALYAIGSGNFWGKGLGSSMQKLGFIPEAQNDMIFSIICEELGIFGAIYVIILFAIIVWRCMFIALNAKDNFESLIAIGVMGHLAIQVILNIAVVTNTIPNTGISLPFISYGGSSVVFLLVEIGLVLNVSRNIEHNDQVEKKANKRKRDVRA